MNTIKTPAVIEHMLSTYKTWYGYKDNIPKKSRYTLGHDIDQKFQTVLKSIWKASYQTVAEKIPTLEEALTELDLLKFLIRLSWELRVIDDKKNTALSEGLNEAGRQLGAWVRGLKTKTSA